MTGRPPTAAAPAAPHLLEEVYNLEDALLVGGFLNTLLRNSDRVHVACLAQLVNVIAPLVTQRERRAAPEHRTIRMPGRCSYARGRVLDLRVESETYPIKAAGLQADFARNAEVPFVDVVATLDEANGQACVLMLNRDWTPSARSCWSGTTSRRRGCSACETITGPDPEGVQHHRAAEAASPRSDSTRRRGQPDDVQAAGAVLHRRAGSPSPRGSVHANRRSRTGPAGSPEPSTSGHAGEPPHA